MATTAIPQQFKRGDAQYLLVNMIQAKVLERLQTEDGEFDGVPTNNLFEFELENVENLYSYDQNTQTFRFDFTQFGIECRCSTKIKRGAQKFDVRWNNDPFTEQGINYAGTITVSHAGCVPLQIRVNGARGYDPAGNSSRLTNQIRKDDPKYGSNSEVIDPNYWSFMVQIMAAEIMAAKYGAPKEFVQEIQNLTQAVISQYHGRFMMHEWMGDQVIKACYEKMPPVTYHEYIVKSLSKIAPGSHNYLIDVLDRGHSHTKDWLEKVATFGGSKDNEYKITPHQLYFKRIVETEAKKNLQDDQTQDEYSELQSRTNSIRLGTHVTLAQLTKTIPELKISNQDGDDMDALRLKISNVKNEYARNVEEAHQKYTANTLQTRQ